jgi:hypothetical protein
MYDILHQSTFKPGDFDFSRVTQDCIGVKCNYPRTDESIYFGAVLMRETIKAIYIHLHPCLDRIHGVLWYVIRNDDFI